MIHPTRSNLLILKDKFRSVANSIGILKARRQALVREFIITSLPFLQERTIIREQYAMARRELSRTAGIEGEGFLEALDEVTPARLEVTIAERNLMGLRYRDVSLREGALREYAARGYDVRTVTPHTEEALFLFESVIEQIMALAAYESKLKRLGEEITRVTRRTRALEERVVPQLRRDIRTIDQYLGERDREEFYRLKRFKEHRAGGTSER